jgi:hypothetical protein
VTHRPLAGVICLTVFTVLPTSAFAQCQNIPIDGTETITGFIKKSDNTCTVTDGSYVVTGVAYLVDVHATASGSCVQRGTDGQGNCITLKTEARVVANAGANIIGVPNAIQQMQAINKSYREFPISIPELTPR